MIETCVRLIKKYPFILMGLVGIGFMVAPVFIGGNLSIIESVFPSTRPVISPLMISPGFQTFFGALPIFGLTLAVIAIYFNNRSDPDPPAKS